MNNKTVFDYSLEEIAVITGGVLTGNPMHRINRVLTDSRSLNLPGDTMFIAIRGHNHDGHNYITDLYSKGVRNFLISSSVKQMTAYPEASFILVDNTIHALQLIAAYHRKNFQFPVTAITGSNGKTVVKEWLSDLLAGYKTVVRSPKSFNSQLGVPLSLLQMSQEHEIGIFEAGISKPDEMQSLKDIILPEIGIFTNIGPAHQENFEDTREKVREKLKLFSSAKVLIYCSDNKLLDAEIRNAFMNSKTELNSWSTDSTDNAIKVFSVEKSVDECEISVQYKGENYSFVIPFIDRASKENLIHCAIWWLTMGYDFSVFSGRTMSLEPVSMRLEVKEGINHSLIVNDSFNSDLFSLRIAIDTLNHHASGRKKIVILSDILQSGYNKDILYSEVAEVMNRNQVDCFIGVGGNISAYGEKFNMPTFFFSNAESLINSIHTLPISGSAILLKGARTFRFELIMKRLEHKVHETVFQVNLNAVYKNLSFYKSLLPESTKMLAMVKAFSYGSGLLEISNLLQYNRVDYLAVAFADEGTELRRNGISIPIMVMNPDVDSFQQIVEYNLEPELYSPRIMKKFCEMALRNGLQKYPIHLKIDTGMKRLGFTTEDIPFLEKELAKNKNIRINSVFSHLAAADVPEEDDFTRQQIVLFNEISTKIEAITGYPFLRHLSNTSGIERFPEAVFDMVRLGIGLYGISYNHAENLEIAGSLKTIISQIKHVKKGESVGYGRMTKSDKDKVIATIPIGYADGILRAFGNGKTAFYVQGKKAPTIGNICMDMCMIDITDIPASEGDEVWIFKSSEDVKALAEIAGTIPYEIMVHISQRVKRVYIQE
ncbi:MAG: bifunctional UDP-N-acetylmuramoyl-tripeptide:D-alanyl-D-alanine ligase/alanine racemase [Bacteroidetes bacterium HGW-Bacteroidetes-21]|nr:MAG: bifunctional UDP-N-acetylmuramoyl-tripeptide:D-alanyl-D-alanine ligase/alanine racemase [Bacteroidetes bacterium HGW-Bacteroidetes-21]